MAKSWKKLVQSENPDSRKEPGNEGSLEAIQLTLDEIAAQSEELNALLRERQALESEMNTLLQANKPEAENPRFAAGNIEPFKEKRKKEQRRAEQKKKLEARISAKNKEVEKKEQYRQELKEKLDQQKKLLQKKELKKASSESRKSKKKDFTEPEFSRKTGFEKRDEKRFGSDKVLKVKETLSRKKDLIREKTAKAVETGKEVREGIRKVSKLVSDLKERKKTSAPTDKFEIKDLKKWAEKLDLDKIKPENLLSRREPNATKETDNRKSTKKTDPAASLKKLENVFPDFNRANKKEPKSNWSSGEKRPVSVSRLKTIKDDWNQKREQKQQELKDKVSLKRLSDKLDELKRFAPLPPMDDADTNAFPDLQLPDLKEITGKQENKEPSLDDRQQKALEHSEAKAAEKKAEDRREKRRQEALAQKREERKAEERAQLRKERKKEKYT